MANDIPRRIVVIGASGGGVEALTEVLGGLPTDLQAAVFVVLHTSPRADTKLAEVLGRACQLPVRTAIDGEPITLGQVRIAPPDLHLTLDGDCTRLDRGPQQNRVRPAIDALFRSAAVAHGAATIGVVLTGSLSDGSVGLAAITRCGGFGIVQEPRDAAFAGMPRSAIAADSPDVIVPLAEIANQIVTATRGRGTPVVIPATLALESAVGLALGAKAMAHNDQIGTRSAITCSDCGGPLWEIDDEATHFRCLLGHSMSASVLLEEKSNAAVTALWIAVRTLDERARLLADLAISNKHAGRSMAALTYAERRDELTEAARIVRELIGDQRPSDAKV